MQRKSPIRRFAKRLLASPKAVERAKRIKRIMEIKKALPGLKAHQKISLAMADGKKISGKYRGRVGGTMFVEKENGVVGFVEMKNIERLSQKRAGKE